MRRLFYVQSALLACLGVWALSDGLWGATPGCAVAFFCLDLRGLTIAFGVALIALAVMVALVGTKASAASSGWWWRALALALEVPLGAAGCLGFIWVAIGGFNSADAPTFVLFVLICVVAGMLGMALSGWCTARMILGSRS